ncbi:MAG: DUF7662 domain-containing protein [Acidimicrobiales bacterium]
MSQTWTEQDLRAALDRYESELRAAGKARNTITTYVQHPERFINWLVGGYRPAPTAPSNGLRPSPGRTSRYDPLRQHLAERSEPVVRLTFAEIERILGAELPKSARQYRPWWANEQAGTHVHARAWLDAGRRTTNVELNAATVQFIR